MAIAEYSTRNKSALREVRVESIVPSSLNPRKHFEESALQELADSIREHGLLEPLVVRELRDSPAMIDGQEALEIIAGERRWRACKLAGVETVPVRVLDDVDDAKALQLALIENLQRKDLDPIEEAEGYAQLNRVAGMRQAEIAAAVNRSQPSVAKAMSLLGLPEDVRERIRNGELTVAHGVVIAKYKGFPAVASAMARLAVERKITSHALEGGVPSFVLWDLIHSGVLASIDYYEPFDWRETCQKACPFNAYRGDAGSAGICLKPDHLKELRDTAEKERREALQAAYIRGAGAGQSETEPSSREVPELPRLRDLRASEYRLLGSGDTVPGGCSEACTCRGRAISLSGSVVDVCTDPARFAKLEAADRRARNKAVRAVVKAKQDKLTALIDGLMEIDGLGLAVVIREVLASYGRGDMLKESAGRLGIALDNEYSAGRMLYRQLEHVPVLQQYKLALETLLRSELKYAHETGGGTPQFDWVFGSEAE